MPQCQAAENNWVQDASAGMAVLYYGWPLLVPTIVAQQGQILTAKLACGACLIVRGLGIQVGQEQT